MDCPVCMERYDLGRRRPKSLPCGHTLCLHCLLQPQLGNRCPQDRQVNAPYWVSRLTLSQLLKRTVTE